MTSTLTPLGAGAGALAGLTGAGLSGAAKSKTEAPLRENSAPAEVVTVAAEGWRGARETARSGQAVLALAAAAARQAGAYLDGVAAAAAEGRGEDLAGLTGSLRTHVSSAIDAGAGLLSGADLSLALGAEPFVVAGADLRFTLPSEAALASPEAAQAIAGAAEQAARDARAAAARWEEAGRKVSAHEGVLAAATQMGVGGDLNADGARLMALQVRQAMADTPLAIANADPRAILALFKS